MVTAPPSHAPRARLLPPQEWGRLADPALAGLVPGSATIIVVEVDGQIVAHWAAMQVVHVEGLWMDPDYAGHAGVGRALLSAMVEQLRALQVREALTQAGTPEVEALCEKAGGQRVPGTTWVIPIRDQ